MIGVDEFRQREAQWREHFDRVRAVNHHLRLIADQLGEGAIIVEAEAGRDVGPRIVFANRAAGVLTGRKADDLVGEQLGAIYDPEELAHLVSRLPAVAKSNKTFQMEKGAVLADGSVVPFRWSVRSVRDERGQTVNFLLTLRPREDESEAALSSVDGAGGAEAAGQSEGGGTAAEEDERQLAARLEKCRIESLAQLAGGIAHDFNNVLTSIFSHLSLAKLASAPDGEVRGHVVDALESSQNAQSLAQQILDFTKGKLQNNELVDMGKVVQQAAKLSTMGSRVRYDVQIAEDVWGVEGDLGQVRQVIHNFLINAGQAMPAGGVVQAMVRNVVVDDQHPVGDLPPGGYVMACVRDRGCGISQENLERIFEPYFTTKETGSGIGLATCRTIAQRHKGCITVKSKLDAYSEFRLYLPARLIEVEGDTELIDPSEARADSAGATPAAAKMVVAPVAGKSAADSEIFPQSELNVRSISHPGAGAAAGAGAVVPTSATPSADSTEGQRGQQSPPADEVIRGQGRVLVVDDQDDVRIAASLLLERLGYRTVAASDGQSAVRTYRQQLDSEDPISAVLLDMTLPGGLSGDEVMEEVLKLDPQARVIATSGWFDEDAEERFQVDGYVGILPKPYAVESLSQKLHEALTRS